MKTYIIYILISLSFFQGFNTDIFAQKSLRKARNLKANYDYSKAIIHYHDYLKSANPSAQDQREIAESYIKLNDTKSAELWLAKVVSSPSYNATDLLNYAHILRGNRKYSEAINQYKKYAADNPGEAKDAERWINACNQAVEWIKEPAHFEVVNVKSLNTENSDFGLMPFNDGYILTSDRKINGKLYKKDDIYGWTGNPYLKLFYYQDIDKDAKTGMEEAVFELNNEYHNGPSVFNVQKKEIYFTRTKTVKIKIKPTNTDPTSWIKNAPEFDYVNRLEIYTAKNENNTWQGIKPFAYNNPDEYSVGHPALSPDGKILYFASDMKGGYGGSDIYYCVADINGTWSAPKNAGNIINTSGNEVFPYIDEIGNLFFSSDGHAGMGGLDIFEAFGSTDKWSKPQNLKYPVNSSKDDFSILFTTIDKKGFFSSNREGGVGADDVYSFELMPPQNLTIVAITKERLDNKTAVPLNNVNVEFNSIVKGESQQLVTDNSGRLFKVSDCNNNFKITATKEGYLSDFKVLETSCKGYNDTVFVELLLDKIIIGKPIVIKNIFYDFDKWNIRTDATKELDNLVNIMKDNPKINVELGSHTDARGKTMYNEVLSQKRAESAVEYIISKGVDRSRITAKGYGESEPVNGCIDGVNCSDEEFQLNRRTEFKITSLSE